MDIPEGGKNLILQFAKDAGAGVHQRSDRWPDEHTRVDLDPLQTGLLEEQLEALEKANRRAKPLTRCGTESGISVLQIARGSLWSGMLGALMACLFVLGAVVLGVVHESIVRSPAILLVLIIGFGVARMWTFPATPSWEGTESRQGVVLQSYTIGVKQLFNPFAKLEVPPSNQLHITTLKECLFLLLLTRIGMNVSALITSSAALWNTSDWSMATIAHAIDFLVLIQLTSTLVVLCKRGAVGQIVLVTNRLASASSLMLLRNLNLKQAILSVGHYMEPAMQAKQSLEWKLKRADEAGAPRLPVLLAAIMAWLNSAAMMVLFILTTIAGLISFLVKITEMRADEIMPALAAGDCEPAAIARFLMLTNQLMSIVPVDEFRYQTLLEFAFRRGEDEFSMEQQQHMITYSAAVAETMWQLTGKTLWKRLVLVFTFGADDLQKFMYSNTAESD